MIAEIVTLLLKIAGYALAAALVLLIVGILVFRVTVLPAIHKFYRKHFAPETPQDFLVVDVIPNAPLQEHGFTPEEKAKIASEALRAAMENKNPEETPRDALVRLTQIAKENESKREQPELARIRRIALDLFSVFKNDPAHLRYTYEHFSQSISGLNELAHKSFPTITGMLYASEEIKIYVTKLAALASLFTAAKSEALSKSADEFLERMEKLHWLSLIYPAESRKHRQLVSDLLSSLTDKLQVYAKMREYGVEGSESVSAEAKNLLEKTETVVLEMNVALDTVLKTVLERDLIKADTELDALRQDLRLRGLY
jgi:hypothetical protein